MVCHLLQKYKLWQDTGGTEQGVAEGELQQTQKVNDEVKDAIRRINTEIDNAKKDKIGFDKVLLKGVGRSTEEYFLPLFKKIKELVDHLDNEDKSNMLFKPALFEEEKEIRNLALIVTLILTNPSLRTALKSDIDFNCLTKVTLKDVEVELTLN